MIFCRGCGKSIHETAVACPNCGATQNMAQTEVTSTGNTGPSQWASVASLVLGILVVLALMAEDSGQWDQDTIVGGFILGSLPLVFGCISLAKTQPGQWMAITGIILGAFAILVTIGSM